VGKINKKAATIYLFGLYVTEMENEERVRIKIYNHKK